MSPQHIVNESCQKTEVNLEHENERVARREPITSVSESHTAPPRDTKKSEGNPLVLLATKQDMREFREVPTTMPLVLLYKGEVLVSNDMTPLPFGVSSVLQDFATCFRRRYPLVCPLYAALSTRLTSSLGPPCQTVPLTTLTPKKLRRFINKCKRDSTKVIFVWA
jgi:hypothetical protein